MARREYYASYALPGFPSRPTGALGACCDPDPIELHDTYAGEIERGVVTIALVIEEDP